MTLHAFYFDGRSTRRYAVKLSVHNGRLLLQGSSITSRYAPPSELTVSEPQGRAPRTIRFQDGTYCELEDGEALRSLLQAVAYRESAVVRLQNRWRHALISLFIVILSLFAAYHWALPWGSRYLAPHVPVSTLQHLSDLVMKQMDKEFLSPSKIPIERQEKLSLEFHRMATLDPELLPYGKYLTLHFRSAPGIGPNAFALPGGQIILFDELDSLMPEEEMFAVLAHELGHLKERHATRQLIQTSIVGATITAYIGDTSFLLATVVTTLLEARYSRDMEQEADDYAARLLAKEGKSPALLAQALEKLEKYYRKKTGANTIGFPDWLSSHPAPQERMQRLNKETATAN